MRNVFALEPTLQAPWTACDDCIHVLKFSNTSTNVVGHMYLLNTVNLLLPVFNNTCTGTCMYVQLYAYICIQCTIIHVQLYMHTPAMHKGTAV